MKITKNVIERTSDSQDIVNINDSFSIGTRNELYTDYIVFQEDLDSGINIEWTDQTLYEGHCDLFDLETSGIDSIYIVFNFYHSKRLFLLNINNDEVSLNPVPKETLEYKAAPFIKNTIETDFKITSEFTPGVVGIKNSVLHITYTINAGLEQETIPIAQLGNFNTKNPNLVIQSPNGNVLLTNSNEIQSILGSTSVCINNDGTSISKNNLTDNREISVNAENIKIINTNKKNSLHNNINLTSEKMQIEQCGYGNSINLTIDPGASQYPITLKIRESSSKEIIMNDGQGGSLALAEKYYDIQHFVPNNKLYYDLTLATALILFPDDPDARPEYQYKQTWNLSHIKADKDFVETIERKSGLIENNTKNYCSSISMVISGNLSKKTLTVLCSYQFSVTLEKLKLLGDHIDNISISCYNSFQQVSPQVDVNTNVSVGGDLSVGGSLTIPSGKNITIGEIKLGNNIVKTFDRYKVTLTEPLIRNQIYIIKCSIEFHHYLDAAIIYPKSDFIFWNIFGRSTTVGLHSTNNGSPALRIKCGYTDDNFTLTIPPLDQHDTSELKLVEVYKLPLNIGYKVEQPA